MKFRTEEEVAPWSDHIDYSHHILSLGSCFANNIATKLAERKFRVSSSPTGILFNPESIASAVERMASGTTPSKEELIDVGGRWLSYDFHSSVSGATPDEAIEAMSQAIDTGHKALTEADYLIVTLGTAWVYRLKSSGKVVANCHKQPHNIFSRELLSVDEVTAALERIIKATSSRIIFTISPVRHIGEGVEQNSLSKAILRVAVDAVCSRYAERTKYFPSYEIVMDDLRDYRFYGEDLVHPTPMAIDYIAEKFFDVALNNKSKQLMPKVSQITKASSHRPVNPSSREHQSFVERQLAIIEDMPEIDFSEEKSVFMRMLQINL